MFVDVLVNIKSLGEKIFTYSVSDDLKDIVRVGFRVIVPLLNREIEGLIIGIRDSVDFETKPIVSLLDSEPVFDDELLSLGKYMKDEYLCSLMSAYESMLPDALKFNKTKTSIKYETYITKVGDIDNPSVYEKNVLKLFDNGDVLKRDIKSKSTLNRLLDMGVLKEVKREKNRLCVNYERRELRKLTDKQLDAYNLLLNSKKSVCLLRGVTGSGKTEIYMHLIKDVISVGKTVIVLVPEITLTTQLIGRFRSVFGSDIAVLHSALSSGEKYDEYRRIKDLKAKVVIGTRSAVFSPLTNIGLIVIDEEQEDSYKQENEPRYKTFDIALKRCEYNNAKLILGSATPTLESYAKAKIGRYELVELLDRVNNKKMPKVYVVDMKDEIKTGNSILSRVAIDLIEDRLRNKEQIMILINRRGYSNYIMCMGCGNVLKCPNCDISLTYHKTNNTLRCHYCGYATNNLKRCPSCLSTDLVLRGIGTEKIEEYLKDKFSSARVVRMDRDTTTNKGMHEKIVKDFNDFKYDILLGTQMISKGLDFVNVTLVIVLSGDASLNIPDYRSAEKTFDMLTQVSGRSGRGKKNGVSLIQTFNPNHYSIILSKNHDYFRFYNEEMKIRKKLNYPPFCLLVSVRILSKDFELGSKLINKINKYLKGNLDDTYTILGPTQSFKINNIYHYQIILKYQKDNNLYDTLKFIDSMYKNNSKVKVEFDFDPIRI